MTNISETIKISIVPILKERNRIKQLYADACAKMSRIIDGDVTIPLETAPDWKVRMCDELWDVYKEEYEELDRLIYVIRHYEKQYIIFEEERHERFLKEIFSHPFPVEIKTEF